MNPKLLVLFCIILFSFISCNRDEESIVEKLNPSPTDVYVAGIENNKACYWKNGVINYLQNGDGITPEKIIVENNNVYVFGANYDATFNLHYFYWKNNIKYDVAQYLNLPPNPTVQNSLDPRHSIYDFIVDNGNLYFLGNIVGAITVVGGINQYDFEQCYWKNTTKNSLINQNIGTFPVYYIKKFAIYNNDVYIPATKVFSATNTELGYFKNNTYQILSSTPTSLNFQGITSSSNAVYLTIFDEFTNQYYYKNLLNNINIFTSSIGKLQPLVDGNDIYDFGVGNGHYTKNDTGILLQNTNGFDIVIDLKVKDAKTYMIRTNFQPNIPSIIPQYKVFINNIETQTISSVNGTFNSIFVVQN